MFARTEIIGNIGKDPVIISNPGKKPFITFNVAVSSRSGDKNYTTWFKIISFSDSHISKVDNYKKGRMVRIEGRPEAEGWTDNNGTVQAQPKIMASTILPLSGKPEQTDDNNGFD